MTYLKLAVSFLKVGLLSIGGGYAMLPLIQHEVVDSHQWLTRDEFVDVVAIAEMTPGPLGLNVSTYTGYKIGGLLGSAVATASNILPTLVLMLIICRFFFAFRDNERVSCFFRGFRPVVIGLIAAADVLMGKVSVVDYRSVAIVVAAFVCGYKYKLHPILLIILSALAGIILY